VKMPAASAIAGVAPRKARPNARHAGQATLGSGFRAAQHGPNFGPKRPRVPKGYEGRKLTNGPATLDAE